ncbi:MAG: efflux RND transporter periplasmic adaptor subunit [Tepidimonas taiwanensis]|uniref:efflux RND transporter periplasmic adaptor subunit n=1 Tax=Tepidimonas taiwanensis TaxID=307486 RepID=UPI00068D2CF8|nr:efflux RND transporter periplasmic adaptor subunit [Tepidimonas taiwanensis]MDM7463579.1 efflux RND transporter periplasmic adaptor subunit [Tepidimonas taiwanensis]
MAVYASRLVTLVTVLVIGAVLTACQQAPATDSAGTVPYVRTAAVQPVGAAAQGLSGIVRARIEAPLAFQVGGRIIARRVDAGQAVSAGQVLFELDPADLEQAVRAAEADAAAAETAWRTAQAEWARVRELQSRGFVSAQALERAELAVRETHSRRDAATARLTQARNARGYAQLRSPAAGVLIDVSGQPGQVVAAGQPVATLAQQGEREVEVHFPDGVPPPAQGEALLPDGQRRALRLREAAPAVDPLGRTRRARYTIADLPPTVALGSVVTTRFALPGATGAEALWQVPVGALDERGHGPRVWRLRDGKPEPVAVQVRALDDRHAIVAGALEPTDRIVALGTHLLQEGMAVRELPR